MYEQLDGILTCRDLVPAGRAGLRRPWVPRQGRTNRTSGPPWGLPKMLQNGLLYPTWALASLWGLQNHIFSVFFKFP